MRMNKATLNGRIVRIGNTPVMLRECGYTYPSEVAKAAKKYGKIVVPMRVDDVADFFEELNGKEGV